MGRCDACKLYLAAEVDGNFRQGGGLGGGIRWGGGLSP